MSTYLTRKRPRLNSNEDENTQPMSKAARLRDEEFWYSDGSIVLVARNVEFRVYQGILSDHSPVFKDMFSLPQPDDASPSGEPSTGDRCPVVHLSDSPEDLRHILRFYMPRSHTSPFLITASPSIHMISAAARLGHKYQMSELVKHAAEYLKEFFTTDLDTWMKADNRFLEGGFDGKGAIEVVNIARLIGEPTLLPTALLVCCGLDYCELTEGFQREDGSFQPLTTDDIGRCFAARTNLLHSSMQIMLTVLTGDDCRTRKECRSAFIRALGSSEQYPEVITEYKIFVTNFSALILMDSKDLCRACRGSAREREKRETRAAWCDLPALLYIEEEVPSAWSTGGSASAAWPTLREAGTDA
ncbi:hypothetical protein C2E23DRAFT_502992 [Lenzites betulinus]|nr:hypothetical protein C2E23DRAFT_502992 [Lenzites betulinus]